MSERLSDAELEKLAIRYSWLENDDEKAVYRAIEELQERRAQEKADIEKEHAMKRAFMGREP